MKNFLFLFMIFLLSGCAPDRDEFDTDVPEVPVSDTVKITPSELQNNHPELKVSSEGVASKEGQIMPSSGVEIRNEDKAKEKIIEIPAQINLEAPFYAQAPDRDWSYPWQDACEEASLILAHYGMTGEELTKDKFRSLVLKMVDWENEHFGYYNSTPVDMVVELYQGFFEHPLEIKVLESPTLEELKKELAQGHLIVAPFAGRYLNNPFYSNEGPYYHMMVLKGYDDKGNFITNDVGINSGGNFVFSQQNIMESLHDYVEEPGIENQPARVIVFLN